MSPRVLTLVTGNSNKLREVKQILHDIGDQYVLASCAVDLPELQGDPADITRAKTETAFAKIQGPVLVEDTCLCFNALGGLPGPYIKWFLEKLGHEGLNRLLLGWEDKSALAMTCLGLKMSADSEVVILQGITRGRIVPPRGQGNFGWDPIFEPDGSGQTYGEMSAEQKNAVSHRYKALDQLRGLLLLHRR